MNPEVLGTFIADDYFEELARLRRDEPVRAYAPRAWTVARYEDVREVSHHPERFCSGGGVLMNDPLRTGGGVSGSILHMDPPEHAPWRKLVSRRFTPRSMASLETDVRRVARSVLATVEPGEEVEFVDRIAAPFPVFVIAELLGISHGDRADFRRWSDAIIESPDHPGEGMDDILEMFRFLSRHARDRRDNPSDDLATVVVQGEIEGRPVTIEEAVGYLLALLVAGNETTRHLVSGSVIALSEDPEQRALLAREPDRIPTALEECLRWVTPIQAFGRTATADTMLGGQPIAGGDFLVMLYASANRDERAFGPTAGAFDVTRPIDTSHLAFGFGEHLCLGAALARLEGRVFLEELLARFPEFAVSGEPVLARSTLVRGATQLPVLCR
ncbi:MAG: cytochrome [Actinomycetia bacterium]|nr:cytochrome [Actinomycetes bacterium]